MKRVLVAALGGLGVVTSTFAAHAQDEKQICAAAYTDAQTRRDEHKLLAAREQLHVCSRPQCASFMSGVILKDCTDWLAEVEANIPSVVLGAKDASGIDLVDVTVSIDGVVVTTRVDGRAIDVDPGTHVFRFETTSGLHLEQTVPVFEGKKNQFIRAQFAPPEAPPNGATAAVPAAVPTSTPTTVARPNPPLPPPATTTSPLRPIGYAVGALGIVGLGLGAYFGVHAKSQNDSSFDGGHCDNTGCDATGTQTRNSALGSATASTVLFALGGAAVAGGIAILIFAPSEGSSSAAHFEAAPLVGIGFGGVSLRGGW